MARLNIITKVTGDPNNPLPNTTLSADEVNSITPSVNLLYDGLDAANTNIATAATNITALQSQIASTVSGFKGSLATTDTPTAGVAGYYFPTASGTYTNAGGLVVNLSDGLNIITQTAANVFTKIVSPLDFKDTLVLNSTTANSYISTKAGAIGSDTLFTLKYFEYTGKPVNVTFRSGSAKGLVVLFLAADKTTVLGAIGSETFVSNTTYTDYVVTPPANTVYVAISGLTANTLTATSIKYALNVDLFSALKSITTNTSDIVNIKGNKSFITESQTIDGFYLANTAGVQTANASFAIKMFPYVNGSGDAYLNFTSTTVGRIIVFYDSALNPISGVSTSLIPANTTFTDFKVPAVIPANTAFIGVSGVKVNGISAYINKYALSSDVNTLVKNSKSLLVDSTVPGVYLDTLGRETTTANTVYTRYFVHAGGTPYVNFKSSTINRRVVFLNSLRKVLTVFGSDTLFASNTIYENYKVTEVPADTAFIGITSDNGYQSYITEPVTSLRVDTTRYFTAFGDSIDGRVGAYIDETNIPGITKRQRHVGGETTLDTLAYVNAQPYMIDPKFNGTAVTIPADNATGVSVQLYSKEGFAYAPNGTGGVNWTFDTNLSTQINPDLTKPVTIAGIDGILSTSRSPSAYSFKRNVAGAALTLSRPLEVYNTDALKTRNTMIFVMMGTNGGWRASTTGLATNADADNLVSQWKKLREYISPQNNNYVFMGHYLTQNKAWFDYYNAAMSKEFGQHYFNMYEYLLYRCFDDIGATPTSGDITAMNAYQVPPSLLADGTHPTTIVNKAAANRVMERFVFLGSIDYYIPNVLV